MSTPLIEFGSPVSGITGSAVPSARVKVPPPPRPQRSPVSVNGVPIPHEAISAEAQQHPASSPAEAFRLAAEALVVRELLLSEARACGTRIEPERDARGRPETEEDAQIRALLEQRITTPVADEAACRRYYENNLDRFGTGSIFEARHILLAAKPHGEEGGRADPTQTAQLLVEELTADPSRFGELARAFSACPSREAGGNLGQLTAGSTVPEFESRLAQMQEGELGVVSTRFGCHVVKLDKVIPSRQLPFEAVRDRIAGYLEASSWSSAVAEFIGILAQRAEISGIELDPANEAAA